MSTDEKKMKKCDPPSSSSIMSCYTAMLYRPNSHEEKGDNVDDDIPTSIEESSLQEPLLPAVDTSSMTSSEILVYGDHDEDDVEEEDLLDMQEQSMKWSKCYCLIIGLIVGCFIQFSSLGANFIVTSIYGTEALFLKEYVAMSLVWCFVTSMMGVAILMFLRSLVVTSFYATTSVNKTFEDKEDFVATLIQNMEYHFAIGSLIGVCTSWTLTDIVIGMKAHVAHSLVTLFVALVWCRLVLSFWGSQPSRRVRTEKTKATMMMDVA